MDSKQPQQSNPQNLNQQAPQPHPQAQAEQQSTQPSQQNSQSGSTPPQQGKKGHSKTKILIIAVIIIGSLPFLMIFLSIILIAINPERQFNQANDTTRASDVTQILNAVGAYYADNNGVLPNGITTFGAEISSNGADICEEILGTYIPSLPVDPDLDGSDITSCQGEYSTGYFIVTDGDLRVTVSAPNATLEGGISVTR